VKFGVNTLIWSAGIDCEVLDRFPAIRRQGFDGVEMPLIGALKVAPSEIRRALEENKLAGAFCTIVPRDCSPIAPDAAERQRARGYLADCVRTVAEAGGSILAGPLYAPVGHLPGHRRTPDEWRWAIECLQSLGPTLESYGVVLALEPLNRFETYFLNTASDALQLAEEIAHPMIGVLFDTFHANIEEKDVAAAIRSVGPRLIHFHACENDRGTPGSGHVDWPGVFRALTELRYDGWVTIESFAFNLPELSAAAAIWRDLALTPEAIAFEGVQFLKRGLVHARQAAASEH
jgi:D-psicose/D-tagatose/L-ribulose 3-epimerase